MPAQKDLPTLRAHVWLLPVRGLVLNKSRVGQKLFQPALQVKAFSNTQDLPLLTNEA